MKMGRYTYVDGKYIHSSEFRRKAKLELIGACIMMLILLVIFFVGYSNV